MARKTARRTRWLDQGNRRAGLWSVFGVVGLVLMPVVLFAIVLLGAWLGLWQLAYDP
jgi:hypothetical protein